MEIEVVPQARQLLPADKVQQLLHYRAMGMTVRDTCEELGISQSTYYLMLSRQKGMLDTQRESLIAQQVDIATTAAGHVRQWLNGLRPEAIEVMMPKEIKQISDIANGALDRASALAKLVGAGEVDSGEVITVEKMKAYLDSLPEAETVSERDLLGDCDDD